jgi:hypothetical protein
MGRAFVIFQVYSRSFIIWHVLRPERPMARNPRDPPMQAINHIRAGVLNIGYAEAGPANGRPVFLMHGFPYDIQAYAEVAPVLADAGCRVIVPYLRGFGPTRFLGGATPRSGEQAALGADLLALMDALAIPRAVPAWPKTGARLRGCCGSCGRPPGPSMTRPSPELPPPSTTLISWRW